MASNKLMLCLFGISACLASTAVAKEAVINGELARLAQFPYQISLQTSEGGHHCGGGIINEDFVLTAASCVIQADGRFIAGRLTITAGTTDLLRTALPAVSVPVAKIYVSSQFNPTATVPIADIAVLKLTHPLSLRLNRYISALQLPRTGNVHYVDEIATVAGWGWNWIQPPVHGGRSDFSLRFADADVIGFGEPVYPRGRNALKHICARVHNHLNERRGVCKGDIGGPLVFRGVVIGILSLPSPDCTERTEAATYTRVSKYLQLITYAFHDRDSRNIRTHVVPQ